MGTVVVISIIAVFVVVVVGLEIVTLRKARRRVRAGEQDKLSYDPTSHEGANYSIIESQSTNRRNTLGGI